MYIAYSSTYIHKFTLNIYKCNEHFSSECPAILLPKCEPVFKKSSYFCCCVSLDSLHYFLAVSRKSSWNKARIS